MEFKIITEQEYNDFLDKYPDCDFLNAPAIGHNHKQIGYKLEYYGVFNKKLCAAAMIVSKKGSAYVPRGFLVDYNNYELLAFLTNNVKDVLKKQGNYVLTIDPRLIYHERDINGDIVIGGVNNIKAVENLKKIGFKKNRNPIQMVWQFAMDFNDETKADDILKNMRSFTKRNLKKGLHNQIEIRKVKYEDLNLVKEILYSTSERKHFESRSLEYFQHMYKNFGDKIDFLIASLNIPKYLKVLENDLNKEQAELEKAMAKNQEGKIKNYQDSISSLNKKIEEAHSIQKKHGDILDISSAIFINFGNEVTYLFGGNIKEYLHFGAAYVMQWYKINYAIDNKFKRYNFYGISNNFDKNSESYGVYDFKKGFGGYVIELVGEFDLILGNKYFINKLIKNSKDVIKKIIRK